MKKTETILDSLRTDRKNKLKLDKCDPAFTEGVDGKKEARAQLAEMAEEINDLQYKLYAESRTAVLVVIQAIDTGGKDGTIRNVFGPLNPQGVVVTPFKQPTPQELARDFLWRVHSRVPAKGAIGIFNRSHYEDVIVHRVHKLISNRELDRRYRQINDFERLLSENGTVILKLFLHISKDEQRERLQARLDDPAKNWKFEMGDLEERKSWDKYQEAFQAMLDNCSTGCAPWHVVPADKKWYRDWVAAGLLLRTLRRINPKTPEAMKGLDRVKVE